MGIWTPGEPLPDFPTVEAEHFERQLHGRNKAVLLGCMSATDGGVTCVVKLYHRLENKPSSYWTEWVAGVLAKKLGINSPEQLVVNISQEVASVIREQLSENASTSARPSFGTRYVTPNVQFINDSGALEEDLREAAGELAVFDVFIDNPDRRVENPNLVIDARNPRRLLAIDHDLAFSSFNTHLIGGGNWPFDLLGQHILKGRFGNNKPDLARVRHAIAGLSDEFLEGLPEATPSMWLGAAELTKLEKVVEKLKQRRDTIDSWFPTVERWM